MYRNHTPSHLIPPPVSKGNCSPATHFEKTVGRRGISVCYIGSIDTSDDEEETEKGMDYETHARNQGHSRFEHPASVYDTGHTTPCQPLYFRGSDLVQGCVSKDNFGYLDEIQVN